MNTGIKEKKKCNCKGDCNCGYTKKPLFSITKNDFEITYFSGKGAGGQHRNRHMNCVRIKHKETGIMKTGQTHKSLHRNREEAFKNLVSDDKFKMWLRRKSAEAMQSEEDLKEKVNKMMDEKFLKVEKYNNEEKKWEKLDEDNK